MLFSDGIYHEKNSGTRSPNSNITVVFVFHPKLNNLLHTSKTLACLLSPPKKTVILLDYMTKLYNEHFAVCSTYQNQGPTNILWCVLRTRIRAL